MKKVNIKETKEVIHELYNSLMDRPQKPSGLLDITDVLLQVYKKLDTVKYPEYLINKLVTLSFIADDNATSLFLPIFIIAYSNSENIKNYFH